MPEGKKNAWIPSGIAVLTVVLAYLFRLVGKGSFYPTLFSYLRGFLYIGLFAAWGLSVRQRIVQKQVRWYLTGVSVLLIFWMVIRSAKYFIFWQPDAIRYLWYFFYLPMLFVPVLAVLIAMSLGKPDDYRLPKAAAVLWGISAGLFFLVLTNDLHQLVFTFPEEAAVWTDRDNGYAAGYFFVLGWQVLCGMASLVLMFVKCRVPGGRRRLFPVIPLLLSLVYSALYYTGNPWLRHLFGDVTAFQSVMYVLTFELCILCGYIHSNSRYADLFAASVGTSAQITDEDYHVRYAAFHTEPIDTETMQNAEQHPVSTADGLMVHTMPIHGGYAVWTEDVSALVKIREQAKNLTEELRERNDLLRYEYKLESERRRVEEQNRLYDLLQAATQRQIDRILVLTKDYQEIAQADPSRAKSLLAQIAVLCSYIKRRKHLTLLADRDARVDVGEMERAFSESMQTLKLLQVRSTLYIDSALSTLPGETAAAVFDFYESVVEADLHGLRSIQVSLTEADPLRLSLQVCCRADLSSFASRSNVRYELEDEDGYQHLIFFPEGGGGH